MKTNNLPEVVIDEFHNFDFRGLAHKIMSADGLQYSVVIDDDGSLYWDYNVCRKVRGDKDLVVMDCPYYSEPVKVGVRSLVKELRGMLYDKIMSIPDGYWRV